MIFILHLKQLFELTKVYQKLESSLKQEKQKKNSWSSPLRKQRSSIICVGTQKGCSHIHTHTQSVYISNKVPLLVNVKR